jgi:predicted NodU family carbamoyl transferase
MIQFGEGKFLIRKQKQAIEKLCEQQMVAIFQGEAEIGPRALGNRSLMFDPTNPFAKEIVNSIKEREEFRPFAGSMLLEYFDEYFHTETLKESPYMSYAIKVKEEKVHEISSIVHHDYTCRIQTVTEEQNKNYYNLDDAMDTCNRSNINFLYVPEDQDIEEPEPWVDPEIKPKKESQNAFLSKKALESK